MPVLVPVLVVELVLVPGGAGGGAGGVCVRERYVYWGDSPPMEGTCGRWSTLCVVYGLKWLNRFSIRSHTKPSAAPEIPLEI